MVCIGGYSGVVGIEWPGCDSGELIESKQRTRYIHMEDPMKALLLSVNIGSCLIWAVLPTFPDSRWRNFKIDSHRKAVFVRVHTYISLSIQLVFNQVWFTKNSWQPWFNIMLGVVTLVWDVGASSKCFGWSPALWWWRWCVVSHLLPWEKRSLKSYQEDFWKQQQQLKKAVGFFSEL